VIGCEYTTIFMHFGKTRVNLIDRAPRILPFEDDDVAEVVATNFEAAGVHIHRAARLEELAVRDGMVEYVITNADGGTERLRVEKALVSIGRVPNTAGLGLEEIGVRLTDRGGVEVEKTRTSVPHIYAIGDLSVDLNLVNVAELEGRYAVETMFGLEPRAIHYEALSTIMFLDPEIACVGLNEIEARKRGIRYRVGVVANRLVSRNVAMRETRGLVKLLAEADTDRILGMRVVGPEASATVPGVAFLIDMGVTLEELDDCGHPHPSVPEGVQECARLLLGNSIMKLEVFGPDGLLRRGEG
jgi:dihydrolipoamide dehydrogenase